MKVLMINGSPNAKGCTYTALEEVAKSLAEEGIESEIIHIGNKDVRGCLGCRKCIKACPTGALGECGTDGYKCLSYITQKKGELTQQEQELMRKCGTVWGCDICQDVCPHNADAEQTDIDEFREDLIDTLKLDSNISNKEFRRIYGKRAFAWRGKAVLVRNLEILAD